MRRALPFSGKKNAQTLVFFLLAFGTIFLLCGFAIDSGLLYLAKARLSRAVDGAALAAVGNFHQSDDPQTNRDKVATTMRNFAAANYRDLEVVSNTATGVASGTTPITYTYIFNDGTADAAGNPPFRRYVEVILKTGAGGQITSATCNARCPVRTYFMGYAGAFFRDLKVSSAAVATRNPRLIMLVVDRSGSMLETNGGAYGLPSAIVTFLNFFDTTSDYIGIVSFSSNARLEMPLTTNFLVAGTNVLYNAYEPINQVPGVDPEQTTDPNYDTIGVRRMKFGGSTSADEGIRMGLEQMMANPGFSDPDVSKYLILFTDGAWNNARTLLAAPGYTNTVRVPALGESLNGATIAATNFVSTLLPVPTLSPYSDYTNALVDSSAVGFATLQAHHTNDVWQSMDGEMEPPKPASPISLDGTPTNVVTTTFLGSDNGTNAYATILNVWLQPGSVDYVYAPALGLVGTYVSCYTNSTLTTNIVVPPGGTNVLVVPGYVIDGTFTDSLDLPIPDDGSYGTAGLAAYRADNYLQPYMWPDDPTPHVDANGDNNSGANSTMRQLMYRNYVNLLTGYYVYRADDPVSSPPTTEPLDFVTNFFRPLHGLGPYYPSAGFYWPFGDLNPVDNTPLHDALGQSLGPVGADKSSSAPLVDPVSGLPAAARHLSYSINMLSTNASPNWAGELFYRSTQGTNVLSDTTAQSSQITSADDYKLGAPGWLADFIQNGLSSSILLEQGTQYGTGSTNIINGAVLRPYSFNGGASPTSNANRISFASVTPTGSLTGGYVTDGAGNYYSNAMAYSGRPTHYYDFANSTWTAIRHNHFYDYDGGGDPSAAQSGLTALPLGNWKVQEYAWHARARGVKIYTVGYGNAVNDSECAVLAQVANATNVINAEGVTNTRSFNVSQPLGQQFHLTTNDNIANYFSAIAQQINAALTQ